MLGTINKEITGEIDDPPISTEFSQIGEEDGHFVKPLDNMNRAEAAVVVKRLFDLFK